MKKAYSDDPIFSLHEYNLDITNMELYLMAEEEYAIHTDGDGAGVEYTMANKFIRNLLLLKKIGKDGRTYKPIIIHMKTDGGDWNEGMAIYDTIKACPNSVTIINYTGARSMSSIIFQAADKRIMMPHSFFMFHQGTWGMEGTLKQIKSAWTFDKKDDDVMLDIYVTKMKQGGKFKRMTRKAIKRMLIDMMNRKEDVYLTAKETIEWGLADEIYKGKK